MNFKVHLVTMVDYKTKYKFQEGGQIPYIFFTIVSPGHSTQITHTRLKRNSFGKDALIIDLFDIQLIY